MRSRTFKCRDCGTPIFVDDDQRAQSGKRIPLESEGVPHQCGGRDNDNDSIVREQDLEAYRRTMSSQLEAMGKKINELEALIGRDLPLQRLIKLEQEMLEMRLKLKNKLI